MDFPRLVYRSADVYRRAENQEALDALRADGWFSSVPEAQRGAHDPEPVAEPVEAVHERLPEPTHESGVYTASDRPRPRTKRPK